MAVENKKAPAELFAHWEVTPEGSFRDTASGRVYSRTDWEVEVSYEFMDNPDALQFARALSAQAVAAGSK